METDTHLYLGIGNAVIAPISSGCSGYYLGKGTLEDAVIWGGITLVNIISAIGNLYIYKKEKKQ